MKQIECIHIRHMKFIEKDRSFTRVSHQYDDKHLLMAHYGFLGASSEDESSMVIAPTNQN
ncbi:hypothetical protein [Endozoicomonas sp.]|uniref:hypothetical protein n=1 Tax=Endozoicomonas sp. TaxID=1892382 RepID=UPI00383BF12B